MRRPLFHYQAEGAAWMAERLGRSVGAILADEPGLGKTIQTLAAVVAARRTPFVVVCPSSVKGNWQREVRYLAPELRIVSLDGRQGAIEPAHGYVLNYEILREREAQLGALRARCLVLDESHSVKEPEPATTHRAAVATRLARRMGTAVLLTGTPLLNRPAELWRLLHIAEPMQWNDFGSFRQRYCLRPPEDDPNPGVSVITEHGEVYRLDELRARTDEVVLRRLKADLLAGLPPKQRRNHTVELEPYDRAHYDAAERDVVSWLSKVRSDKVARSASKNEALVRLTMLRHIAAIGKLRRALPEYLIGWYEQQREPLVIFAFHQDVIAGVHAICQRLGLRRSGITGKSSSDERTAEVDRFTMGDADVFIAPVKSAGVGINLQVARHALFLERLWTPSLMSQAEDRLHRIGQSREVVVTYFDADKTVDQYVAEVLDAKQRLIDRVVDDVERDLARAEQSETVDAVMDRLASKKLLVE
jgi:SNF2 family DNA or RNA helicase